MQEEVENRTVTLVVSTTKLTAREMKAAMSKFLAYQKSRLSRTNLQRDGPVKPTGKQTVAELVGQNQGVANIEVAKSGIRDFERIARKYGVDYAIKKDTSGEIPKYLVFFKARDADALTAAFQEYSAKAAKAKGREKPSVLEKLRQFAKKAKETPDRARKKDLER